MQDKPQPTNSTLDGVVPVRTVLRNGSQIVGALALMSLMLNRTDGVIVIDPMISVLLLVASIGFYLMSRAKS